MLPLNEMNRTPPGTTPEMGRIPAAVATFGISRSWLYRMAPDNPGLLVKCGAATLVNYGVLRAILADLPPAQVGAKRQPQERA